MLPVITFQMAVDGARSRKKNESTQDENRNCTCPTCFRTFKAEKHNGKLYVPKHGGALCMATCDGTYTEVG